ncbi:alpha/beta hydrolase family protein [Flavisphingomonas formosensis]|uniref:alpha/beta hydrolase family protein n=1 Tax=Flavisphingomonas formosensis TaxID=861534 RepID=UPI0012FBC083|nr:hypothetical protein [Sphingomonas formosensis]
MFALLTAIPQSSFSSQRSTAMLSRSGTLSDGTSYGAFIPPNWNGTLLLDLDFLQNWEAPFYRALFARGYGAAGVSRNYTAPPGGQYLKPWVDRVLAVEELVRSQFGRPRRVIAWGVSRGGHVAEAMAEHHPERIDAAIAMCIYGGAATIMNQDLDIMFALKALLAPDDPALLLTNISEGPATPASMGLAPTLAAWSAVIEKAGATPQGRARLSLAAAIGQLPVWVDASVPRPDASDSSASADGWLRNLRMRISATGTYAFMRPAYETSAGGNFSWNIGVDYRRLLTGKRRGIVKELYKEAGLDLEADLNAIEAAPRIAPDDQARWFLNEPSVNYGGALKIPVLTMMTIGDPLLPVSDIWALRQAVDRAGRGAMLRMTFTEAVGHCNFTPAEMLAAVETMTHRLDTGEWGDSTSPKSMNALAATLDSGGAHFISYELEPLPRAFLLGDAHP